MNRRLGWIHQLPDIRDFKLFLMPVSLPPAVDLRIDCPPVYDQGDLGSCTANALAGDFEYDRIKQNKDFFMPSRLFIYYNERVIEDTVRLDNGAIIRDGIKTMARQGVCSEKDWPYIINRYRTKPCRKYYTRALKNQITEYYAVNQSSDQLKGCLAAGFPFVFGFSVYQSFFNIKTDGIMPMPLPSESVEGGHAVMCVGYSDLKQTYIVRNSWSEKWGDQGYFYMPYEYIYNANLCSDFWTIKYVEY